MEKFKGGTAGWSDASGDVARALPGFTLNIDDGRRRTLHIDTYLPNSHRALVSPSPTPLRNAAMAVA